MNFVASAIILIRMTIHKLFRCLSIGLFLICVSACALPPSPTGKPVPALSFIHLRPISVADGRMTIYQTASPSDIWQGSLIDPAHLILTYARQRFDTSLEKKITGDFTLTDLRFVKQEQRSSQSWGAFLFQEQEVYDFSATIQLSFLHHQTPYQITINEKLVLSEKDSLAERDYKQFEFFESIMGDLDRAVMDIIDREKAIIAAKIPE